MPRLVIYATAAMLLLGAAPMPYGYYTLLRLVGFIVFAVAAFAALARRYATLPWAYGLMALVFNPVFKLHFPKELWALIDVAAAVLLFATAKSIASRR
jgi:hypothetical protein